MKARYEIWQWYYGKFNVKSIIGYADTICDAYLLCVSLREHFKDRPFAFKAVLIDIYSDSFDSSDFLLDDIDYNVCLDWMNCL